MKPKIVLTAVFLLLSIKVFSQPPTWEWAKSSGGATDDRAQCITTDPFGNVYVVGYFESPYIIFGTDTLFNAGWPNMFIVKYDANGTVVWAKNEEGCTVANANGCTGSANTTLNNTCNTPAALATTNIAATTAMINWTQPTCVYGYSIRRSLHNANNWTTYVITPNTHYTFSGLTHNTWYDWQIRTNCNVAQTSVSNWSSIQTFITLARIEYGETSDPAASFNVYPNPANDEATIVFFSDKEQTYNLRLFDVTGRVVLSINNTSVVGDNQYQMNLSGVPKGVYIVILQNGDAVLQNKIVIQ